MIDEYKSGRTDYDKYPEKSVEGYTAFDGWDAVLDEIQKACKDGTVVAELYPGADERIIAGNLSKLGAAMFYSSDYLLDDKAYHERIQPYLTDDRVFGVMNALKFDDICISDKLDETKAKLSKTKGLKIVCGTGAALIGEWDLLIYFDMTRREIECRFRNGASNWNTDNGGEDYLRKFKQGFFVDWRMADRMKRRLLNNTDYIVDTVSSNDPKMVCGDGFRRGLDIFSQEPFRLVPYFEPEVWGGQWMKEVCDLPREESNYAWAFDGVPEENSIIMRFGEVRVELPSIDIVFLRPRTLLGERVHARFGDEFPIRFDFLDTMGGQNLSLQVHPTTEYIQNTFGMHYTQDESYYILDCEPGAHVYLGLKEDISRDDMLNALELAQNDGIAFDADKYVNVWPVKKHDHLLIPAGTVHCSGSGTMVLEISATPYIFTFKLWDWGRLGLDGKPRPVHLQHGRHVIIWDRTTGWVRDNLINRIDIVSDSPAFKEEKTGLHEREFIQTRRYTLYEKRSFACDKSVSMCNVVDGEGVVISSVDGSFEPYTAHYAETFIIPASVKEFLMEPVSDFVTVLRATVR